MVLSNRMKAISYYRSIWRQESLAVETAVVADGKLLVSGWLSGRGEDATHLTPYFCGRPGPIAPIERGAARPDATHHLRHRGLFGAQAYDWRAMLPAPIGAEDGGVLLVVVAGRGKDQNLSIKLTAEPRAARAALLRGVALSDVPEMSWMTMLGAIQTDCVKNCQVRSEISFGKMVAEPTASLIVPLYGPSPYLAAQYMALASDPDLNNMEVIFVLDDPGHETAVRRELTGLFFVAGLPCRLLIHNQNGGFAVAINHGAARARGRYLLLLNSDILPRAPGWLGELLKTAAVRPDLGCLGARLLYANGQIQHAGVTRPKSGQPPIEIRYQGLPAEHPPAGRSGPVEAVTGACLLISRELFATLGGLDEGFIVGDYEDIDLCLKCQERGLVNYYDADVVLWHFERQSFIKHELAAGRRWQYNEARFRQRWPVGERG